MVVTALALYPRFWFSLYTKTLRQRTLSRPPAVARKDVGRVRLYSRPGNDLTYRFTLIVESLARLRSRSCIIDGEAVCCGDDSGPAGTRRAKV